MRSFTGEHTIKISSFSWRYRLLVLFSCCLLISGCALRKGGKKRFRLFFPGGGRGVYHTVHKGQTLWRIAKVYGVDVEKIARYNRLDDKADIKVDEKLYIPGAAKVKYVPPYPQSPGSQKNPQQTATPDRKTAKKHGRSLPLPEKVGKQQKIELIWPIKGTITSRYGDQGGTHFGIDIAANHNTPIKAAASGRVSYVGYQPLSYGKFVIVQHSRDYATVYAHNAKNIVKVGQKIYQGMTIGYVGSTGNSSGNHLHFEIRYKRKARNPLWYLPRL